MDETVKIYREYFRDIDAASPSTCAGTCDSATPAALGAEGYEIRRCCKLACSDGGVESLNFCETSFCFERCQESRQIAVSAASMDKCVEICKVGCKKRFTIS